MEERMLLKISIACSIIGLIGLFFFASAMEAVVVNIGDLTPDDVGISTKVCGNVTKVSVSKNGHIFLDIEDGTGKIDAVIFNSSVSTLGIDPYFITEDDSICATGKLDVYRNELEIIPKKIEIL